MTFKNIVLGCYINMNFEYEFQKQAQQNEFKSHSLRHFLCLFTSKAEKSKTKSNKIYMNRMYE